LLAKDSRKLAAALKTQIIVVYQKIGEVMVVPADVFDITNGAVLLRIICGLFFFPHIYFKIVGNPPSALGFFQAAGFRPAMFFMRLAIIPETLAALGLTFGIYTVWAALLGAGCLAIAAIAVCTANRSVIWLWNLKGMEFPVFWTICCIVVAQLSGS
jgi:putative oxidoreductase